MEENEYSWMYILNTLKYTFIYSLQITISALKRNTDQSLVVFGMACSS